MFLLNLKQLIRDKKVVFIYIIGMIIHILYSLTGAGYWSSRQYLFSDGIRYHISGGNIVFIIFLLISFLWFSRKNDGVSDIQATIPGAELKSLFFQWSIPVCLIILYGIVSICFCISITYAFSYCYIEYIGMLLQAVILYIMLPAFFASVLGAIAATYENKLMGYIFIPFFIFIFSTSWIMNFSNSMNVTNVEYRYFYFIDIFKLFGSVPNIYDDYYHTFSLEAADWQKIIMWILLSVCLYVSRISLLNKWKLLSIPLLAGTTIMFAFYCQPSSRYCVYGNCPNDSWLDLETHYDNLGYKSLDNYEWEGFRVLEYDMKFMIGRILKADVKLKVDRNDIENYYFTLFYGYQVDYVEDDNGNRLPFQQKGDYLIITNKGTLNETLNIVYHGASNYFISNSRASILPEYFEYYPVPGMRTVYEASHQFSKERAEKAVFHVLVDADYEVYSNLKKISYNEFESEAEGVSLFGGTLIKTVEAGSANIIYPSMRWNETEILQIYNNILNKYSEEDYPLEGKDWIAVPMRNLKYNEAFIGDTYFLGDEHFLINQINYLIK